MVLKFSSETVFVKGNPLKPYVHILINSPAWVPDLTDPMLQPEFGFTSDIRGLGFLVFRFCPVPLAHVVLEKEFAQRKATV